MKCSSFFSTNNLGLIIYFLFQIAGLVGVGFTCPSIIQLTTSPYFSAFWIVTGVSIILFFVTKYTDPGFVPYDFTFFTEPDESPAPLNKTFNPNVLSPNDITQQPRSESRIAMAPGNESSLQYVSGLGTRVIRNSGNYEMSFISGANNDGLKHSRQNSVSISHGRKPSTSRAAGAFKNDGKENITSIRETDIEREDQEHKFTFQELATRQDLEVAKLPPGEDYDPAVCEPSIEEGYEENMSQVEANLDFEALDDNKTNISFSAGGPLSIRSQTKDIKLINSEQKKPKKLKPSVIKIGSIDYDKENMPAMREMPQSARELGYRGLSARNFGNTLSTKNVHAFDNDFDPKLSGKSANNTGLTDLKNEVGVENSQRLSRALSNRTSGLSTLPTEFGLKEMDANIAARQMEEPIFTLGTLSGGARSPNNKVLLLQNHPPSLELEMADVTNVSQLGKCGDEKREKEVSITVNNVKEEMYVERRYCTVCNFDQPLRSRHCRDCKRCVAKYDHHCPWMGNCIGERNHSYFYWFLVFQSAEMIWAEFLLIKYLVESAFRSHINIDIAADVGRAVLSFAILVVFVMVFSLLLFHSYLACVNLTTWEKLSWNKISYLKEWPKRHGSPFSRGFFKNLFFFCWEKKAELKKWRMPKVMKESLGRTGGIEAIIS